MNSPEGGDDGDKKTQHSAETQARFSMSKSAMMATRRETKNGPYRAREAMMDFTLSPEKAPNPLP